VKIVKTISLDYEVVKEMDLVLRKLDKKLSPLVNELLKQWLKEAKESEG